MREISPAELQELQQATTQRIAQMLITRQRTGRDTHYYGVQAERFKKLAADTRLPGVQAGHLRIASIYHRLAELAESAVGRPKLGGKVDYQRQRSPDDTRSAPTATDDGAAASRGGLKEQSALALVNAEETQIARQALQLTNDQRQIASAALVKLSRSLCDITAALIRETREKLGRILK